MNAEDIVGTTFTNLTVTRYVGLLGGKHTYDCSCSCGGTKRTDRAALKSGHTKSCGCYFKAVCWKNRVTHGDTVKNGSRALSPEYMAWNSMKDRCTNKAHPSFHNYGGRGITVHPTWVSDFNQFLLDVGPRPSPSHSLDRKENNEGYVPGNVVWSTRKEQGNNRRTNVILTLDGMSKTMTQWAETTGISKNLIHDRLKRGWDVEKTLSTKPRGKSK